MNRKGDKTSHVVGLDIDRTASMHRAHGSIGPDTAKQQAKP
jgi:hypothetical protein